jgi:hypothetical protein
VSEITEGNVPMSSLSFIHQWLYSPLLGPGLFFSVAIIFTQTVGLLVRVISLSQGLYLHTGRHKHRINAYTDIHALSGIRTHDPSVRASEDSSCLRPCAHCDQLFQFLATQYLNICGFKQHKLESEGFQGCQRVKYGHGLVGLGTKSCCDGEGQQQCSSQSA